MYLPPTHHYISWYSHRIPCHVLAPQCISATNSSTAMYWQPIHVPISHYWSSIYSSSYSLIVTKYTARFLHIIHLHTYFPCWCAAIFFLCWHIAIFSHINHLQINIFILCTIYTDSFIRLKCQSMMQVFGIARAKCWTYSSWQWMCKVTPPEIA
jgi:hypothetical protein